MGPTASGKTELALYLADRLPCELISVDSALIYRGMDIGTAKPDSATLARYPHHLVDIIDPAESYSAALFRADVIRLMADITARGRIPLLVGGTMLYFRSLAEGLAQMPAADFETRRLIEQIVASEGWEGVHARLAEVDPAAALRIHRNDPQRLQRAYEVYLLSGISLTEWHRRQSAEKAGSVGRAAAFLPYTMNYIAVAPLERHVLHERIATRFSAMMQQGFLDEVQALHARSDLHCALPSVRAVGYRQLWDHCDGKLSLEAAVERGVIATRQMAKRQMTWLRGWQEEIDWFNSLDPNRFDLALKRLERITI
jgi:tRNA dimethylallyltransferase